MGWLVRQDLNIVHREVHGVPMVGYVGVPIWTEGSEAKPGKRSQLGDFILLDCLPHIYDEYRLSSTRATTG